MNFNLTKRAFAEFLGTAFLLTIVVGSGIMGEKLSNGNTAIALLANSLATGTGLFFLITIFDRISGDSVPVSVSRAPKPDTFVQANMSYEREELDTFLL